MNEDQIVAAQFAAELAAGLGYVDKQTTSRPSQQPPALRTNPRDFVKRIVQETRSIPNNQQQLATTQQASVQQIPSLQPIAQEQQQPVLQPPFRDQIDQEIKNQTAIGNIQQLTPKAIQLELSFDVNEKMELLNTLKSIDETLKGVLTFLNENCSKKRRAGKAGDQNPT